MLAGSDYEWPHSLGVNLETGTSTPLPFFVLPTGRIKEGGKKAQGRKKKELTKGIFLLPPSQMGELLPGPGSI